MKTLKVLLQEVVSGIKAWVNSNFAQESNTVHKTGNETVNGEKTFTKNPIIQNNPATVIIKNTGLTQGNIPESRKNTGLVNVDSNGNEVGRVLTVVGDDGGMITWVGANNLYKNGVQDPAGTSVWSNILCHIDPTGYASVRTDTDLIPNYTERFNLGISTNQWKAVYAQTYYYKGTAWGLDQVNAWSNYNRFNGYRLEVKSYSQEIGVLPSSNQWNGFTFIDKNNSNTMSFENAFFPSGETRFKISMVDNYASNSTGSPVWIEFLRLTTFSEGSAFVIGTDTRPMLNNAYELGTSTRKWKTLNGINPGALSFPDFSADYDVSGEIVPPTGENAININGGNNYFTPTVSGWLSIRMHFATLLIICRSTRSSYTFKSANNSEGDLCVCSPVVAGESYKIIILASKWDDSGKNYDHFRLAPCLGNV